MVGHLDLEAGLQDLADEVGQQPALTGELHAVRTRPVHQRLSELAQQRRVRLRLDNRRRRRPPGRQQLEKLTSCRHDRDPVPTHRLRRGSSGRATYTKFLIVPTRKSGKEKANDVPSAVKGERILPGETREEAIERILRKPGVKP